MAKATYLLELVIGAKKDGSFDNALFRAGYGINNLASLSNKATDAMYNSLKEIGGHALDFIKDSMETYKEFEQAMANTAAIANATAQQEAAMEDAARYAGRTTTMTATQSAEALGYMALAGWSVNDSTQALLPILRLAEATQADLQTTSDLVTDSMGALGLKVSDLDMYMDKLVATNNNANTTAEMLMESLIRTGGAADTLGVSLDDTITAVGVLASAGFKAEESGTALNSIFTRIGANKEAAKGLKGIGVSIYDANGNFIGLRETLIKINQAMQGMSDQEKMTSLRLIAGTRRVSQMQYLLDSVGTSAARATSAWDTLENHVVNSQGALDVMNEKATDTVAAAQERLASAWNDLKIEFSESYGDYYKELLDDLALKLPQVTDAIEDFAETHRSELQDLVENAGDFVVNTATKLLDFLGWIIDNRGAFLGAITGTVAGLTALNTVLKVLQVTANLALINPALLGVVGPLLGIAAAIGGVTAAIVGGRAAYKQAMSNLADDSLAEHFGTLSLSMDQVEDSAKRMIYGDTYGLFKAFDSAGDKLDTFQKNVSDAQQTIDQMDWKISVGIGMDSDDNKAYQGAIDNLITNAQDYVEQKHYQVDIAYNMLYGDGNPDSLGIDSYYSGVEQLLVQKGNELRDAMNKAFEDGLLEPDEAQLLERLTKEYAEIQQKVANIEYEANIEYITNKYRGKLDPASQKAMNKELASAADKYNEDIDKAALLMTEAVVAQRKQAEENTNGPLPEAQKKMYEDRAKDIANQANTRKQESATKAVSFGVENAQEAYKEELAKFVPGLDNTIMQGVANSTFMNGGLSTMMMNVYDYAQTADTATQEAIKKYLKSTKDSLKQLEELRTDAQNEGKQIPEGIAEGLRSYEQLELLAGDTSHIYEYVSLQLMSSPEKWKALKDAYNAGMEIPVELARAIAANAGVSEEQIEKLGNDTDAIMKAALSQPITIDKDIKINAVANWALQNKQLSVPGVGYIDTSTGQVIKKNALGGIYDHEILTTAAEEGPEAIIPLNTTARAQSLWTEAGKRMGLLGGRDKVLADRMDAGSTRTESSMSIVFSPTITVSNGSREEVQQATRMAFSEFKDYMQQYERERKRTSFAGV